VFLKLFTYLLTYLLTYYDYDYYNDYNDYYDYYNDYSDYGRSVVSYAQICICLQYRGIFNTGKPHITTTGHFS